MSDENSQELKIHIVSDADNAGFKAAASASTDLGQANSKTADATAELSKKQEEGAEHANVLHENHRLVHKVLHLIAHETGPAAGAALAALGAAAGGGIMLAVFAAKELLHWIHELHEKAHEFRELMESQIDLSPMIKEVGEVSSAVETAKQKTHEYFEDLERKAKESDGWKKIADAQIEQLKRVADEQKKLADAEAERDKAKLEYLKATKQITAEQYAQGMAAIEALKQNKHDDIEMGLSEKSISALTTALSNLELDRKREGDKLEPANERAAAAKQALESLKATLETNRKLLEAHIEKLTGGKEGKDGLVPMLNAIGADDQDIADEFLKQGITKPTKDQIREAGFSKKGAFSYTDPDEILRAIQLMEKIEEERRAEAGNASTVRGIREKLPGAESEAKSAESDAKALEQKISQLERDKKAIEEELNKRRGEDEARSEAGPGIGAAKTVEGAFKAGTSHQGGGSSTHLTALAQAQTQIAENERVIEGLAQSLSLALQSKNSAAATIKKAIDELVARDKELARQIAAAVTQTTK